MVPVFSPVVPVLSMLCMAISGLVCVGLPVGLLLFFRKKTPLKAVPLLMGATAFIVFALVLERLVHTLVLRPAPDGSIALKTTNPWLFILYGAFAAGIFEETGRLFCFLLLKKKYSGVGTALAYGIGHGGIEAVLLAGLTMVSNLVLSLMANGGAAALLGNSPQVTQALATLASVSPLMFLLAGYERAVAITIHLALSVLVWLSVNRKGKALLYPTAIVLHALVDMPAALMQTGIITNVFWVEAPVSAGAALLAVLAFWAHKKTGAKAAPVNE